MTLRKLTLVLGLLTGCLANNALAAYLDFTDSTVIGNLNGITDGFEGITADGIGFTLTSTSGTVNFNEAYDGNPSNLGCADPANPLSGPLACEIDGAGLDNDEITGKSEDSGQVLTLAFSTEVVISSLEFLDLYKNSNPALGGEQVRVSIDGGPVELLDATATSGDGGYASLDFLALGGPVTGQVIEFTAFLGKLLQDDRDNDYAFAGAHISPVPVPAALWLFGTAMLGLLGIRRVRSAT